VFDPQGVAALSDPVTLQFRHVIIIGQAPEYKKRKFEERDRGPLIGDVGLHITSFHIRGS